MNTPIYKTKEETLTAAKDIALTEFPIQIANTTDNDWLIKITSCQCECGETFAIQAIYFAPDHSRHYGLAGFCEACGE